MTSVRVALDQACRGLAAAGVATAHLDARLLLAEALAVERSWLFNHADQQLAPDQLGAFEALLARRRLRQPMSLILGRREFWSLSFRVTEDTLAPRPDSETLVDAVLAALPDHQAPLSLLDLGTGSGCLLLALLSELPAAQGVGVDCDAATLAVAAANARDLGLAERSRFLLSDWCQAVEGRFDLVLSNPPYIASTAIAGLDPEVSAFEPRRALDGGVDGLAAYRRLLPDAVRHLRPDGLLALEIGLGQGDAVGALIAAAGLAVTARRRDLAGIERCLLAGF